MEICENRGVYPFESDKFVLILNSLPVFTHAMDTGWAFGSYCGSESILFSSDADQQATLDDR